MASDAFFRCGASARDRTASFAGMTESRLDCKRPHRIVSRLKNERPAHYLTLINCKFRNRNGARDLTLTRPPSPNLRGRRALGRPTVLIAKILVELGSWT